MGKREASVEKYLTQQAQKAGGLSFKFSATHNNGVPDRIIVLNKTVFVEVKAPGEKPRPLQYLQHDSIRSAGGYVCVVASYEDVDDLIFRLTHNLIN